MWAERIAILVTAAVVWLAPAGADAPGEPAVALAPQTQADPDRALAAQLEDLKMYGRPERIGQTWIEMNGSVYGASPDDRGPIGGAAGYKPVVTGGDVKVTTLEELLAALGQARAGGVIFVDAQAEIDCTERVHVDQLVIEIPAGVTLAGDRGHNGSRGALIFSDTFGTSPLIRAAGDNVRVTGLRIRGPDPKRRMEHHRRSFAEGRGAAYYYKFPTSDGIATDRDRLEVDNCELAGFSHAAVRLNAGRDHHIHHNYIHHCQYNGLGYGVFNDHAVSRIAYNVFDWNRHSIAGTGQPGSGYEADHNVQLRHCLSHCFDMHGGADRGDGTDIAGAWLTAHHNTFSCPMQAVRIRGAPEQRAEIRYNWFSQSSAAEAVSSGGKTEVQDNLFGTSRH